MLSQQVKDYLQANRQRHLEELLPLLRIASVSSQPACQPACRQCAELLAGQLGQLGFDAQLRPWRDHPLVLARRAADRQGAPTVLLYGHYDVQPPEPLELWQSPPFEPVVREGKIFTRGASDDKGQLFAMLKAVEALQACDRPLPNLIVLLEGEEEIGSPDLERFLTGARRELAADYAIICDSAFFAPGLPSLTYGLRGLVYVEIAMRGPAADLHSGTHGGAAPNPLNAMVALLAALQDAQGRVTLPGFYDAVVPLTLQERQAWRKLPFDPQAYAALLGTQPTGGERGVDLLERRWARPTLDFHGIVGGYQGPGAKTVIPAAVSAKVSCRLVANQQAGQVVKSFRQFVAAHTPPGIRSEIQVLSESLPVLVPLDSPAMAAAAGALYEAFGRKAVFVREGASVPISELFQRILGIQPVLMGFGLPDDNLHSPNEKLELEQYYGGIVAVAAVLSNLAGKDSLAGKRG